MVGVKCNFRVERISVPEKKWYHSCFLYKSIHSWYNPLPKSWDTFQSSFWIKDRLGCPELSESDVSHVLVSLHSCLHAGCLNRKSKHVLVKTDTIYTNCAKMAAKGLLKCPVCGKKLQRKSFSRHVKNHGGKIYATANANQFIWQKTVHKVYTFVSPCKIQHVNEVHSCKWYKEFWIFFKK